MTVMAHDKYTKENPYLTKLLENYRLNNEGSSKDTRHFSICLNNSGIEYLPGDALYVCPENEDGLIMKLFGLLELSKDKESEFNRFKTSVNITRASNKLYKLIETKSNGKYEAKALAERFNGYSIPNLLKELKAEEPSLLITSDELVDNSSMLLGRAYSIASSLSAHPGEVHLCIARVEEEINGQKILGVCSNYLSKRVDLNTETVRVYVHHNDKFRLPENPETPIIMVGPGTGIAPFRAFIEERNFLRDQGKTVGQDWLFFGDQRQEFDYLYADELKSYQDKYNLKVSTAFSRDQEHKIYVQNKMQENSAEIFKLLEQGAYFYVCGDARRMAKDVDQALKDIVKEHGKDPEVYIKELKDSKRYCRDVY
ncbi:MAG: protein CysJ [Cyanobacteria bacterium]|nr:protein CysJ [Cyanobacteriota bacterium]